MFEASGCAPPAIPVKAQKPSGKTKSKSKGAELRFNRAEMIFLLSSDITSRVNHSALEVHAAFGPWVASLDQSCTFGCAMLHQGWWKRTRAHGYKSYFTLPA